MLNVEFLIIGAGPTGLGAARRLQELGVGEWALLERGADAGGLASSFVDKNGFTWDVGGHVQFSHYEYFDAAMSEFLGADGWLHHQRESWVWMRDRFIPYPFQYNIHRLPAVDLENCLRGLLDLWRAQSNTPENFGEWIDAKFGKGIASVFMRPYNFKVWAYPPELLNTAWVGERVAEVDLQRVLHNLVFGVDDVSWGPNHTFQFPKHGGTGAIWRSCAARLPSEKMHFKAEVERIDLLKKEVTTTDGRVFGYKYLVSTLPIHSLIQCSGQMDLMPIAEQGLLYSASHIVGLGMRGQPCSELKSKCWMYFPEDDCPFYRVTVFSNYSPFNVPDIKNNWSLMAEVSESALKTVDHNGLLESVIRGAMRARLISSSDEIVSTWQYCARFGYPTPSVSRDVALGKILPRFEERDVFSRGRFGMWKYEVSNQDHSFMQGVEIIERLCFGREELTINDANFINSKKHEWPFARWV